MTDLPFLLHRRVRQTYPYLTPEEWAALKAAVTPLVALPPEQWPAAGARRLATADPLYVVKVNDNLRAFVHPTPGGPPEVRDLMEQETIETLASNGTAPRHEP